MFQKTQDEQYLKIITKRIEDVGQLEWTNQFYEILSSNKIKFQKINDIGCQVGQFYKKIKSLKKISYAGYDIEQKYIDVFKSHFPECSSKIFNLDISKNKPRVCDVTVISATLEHIEDTETTLKNILETTKDVCLIRTFVGDVSKKHYFKKETAIIPCLIKQFSFEELIMIFNSYGFKDVTIIKDNRTGSLPHFIGIDVENIPIIRTFYIFLVKKG